MLSYYNHIIISTNRKAHNSYSTKVWLMIVWVCQLVGRNHSCACMLQAMLCVALCGKRITQNKWNHACTGNGYDRNRVAAANCRVGIV